MTYTADEMRRRVRDLKIRNERLEIERGDISRTMHKLEDELRVKDYEFASNNAEMEKLERELAKDDAVIGDVPLVPDIPACPEN